VKYGRPKSPFRGDPPVGYKWIVADPKAIGLVPIMTAQEAIVPVRIVVRLIDALSRRDDSAVLDVLTREFAGQVEASGRAATDVVLTALQIDETKLNTTGYADHVHLLVDRSVVVYVVPGATLELRSGVLGSPMMSSPVRVVRGHDGWQVAGLLRESVEPTRASERVAVQGGDSWTLPVARIDLTQAIGRGPE
jgi:hypothetical protein